MGELCEEFEFFMRTVIYILSSGRSGSTILEMALGQSNDIYNVGELQLLCLEAKINKMPCGCGKSIDSCDFWGKVIAQHSIGCSENILGCLRNSNRHGHGKAFRLGLILDIIFNFVKHHSRYFDYNEELFNILFRQTNKEIIVDSSKDPYRLFMIKNMKNINIVVIHIRKKLLPYLYSNTKYKGGLWVNLRNICRYYFNFVLMTYITNRYFPHKTINIEYSDFIVQPEKYINIVRSHCNLDSIKTLENISFSSHAVSGNRTRHSSRFIKLDEKWKSHLPKFLSFLKNW